MDSELSAQRCVPPSPEIEWQVGRSSPPTVAWTAPAFHRLPRYALRHPSRAGYSGERSIGQAPNEAHAALSGNAAWPARALGRRRAMRYGPVAELARSLAVFGTASDVGKSVVATALCRHFSDRGVRVAPFKAQNMSNNSGVTSEGAEMGRAQIVQAVAARLEPHVDMNPVLLKPTSDCMSHVVLLGQPWTDCHARDYYQVGDQRPLVRAAESALERLRARYELVVIEGAGSCAEVNLRSHDFVNFPMAHAADAPVVLVADIDRGGVFAQVVGTLDVLPEGDRRRVGGVIINRFRGDVSLFQAGVTYLEQRTGLPVFGVLPFLEQLGIESEDAVPLEMVLDPPIRRSAGDQRAWIAVLRLPHVSNFTDFDPLARHPQVTLHYLSRPRALDDYDLLLLPGTKSVRADLDWLRRLGWTERIASHRERGGRVAGVCGGYQMLGRDIADPQGLEGAPGNTPGLGLLDTQTTFAADKALHRVEGIWTATGAPFRGYEIHLGRTERSGGQAPVRITRRSGHACDRADGAISSDGRVWGTYVHGLFDEPALVRDLLMSLGTGVTSEGGGAGANAHREQRLDALADHFRRHVDTAAIESLLGLAR